MNVENIVSTFIKESNMEDPINYLKNEEGRILRWPKKKAEKLEVLRYIKSKFIVEMKYTEKQVNEIINEWICFNDHALVRRELYDNFLMERRADGREYWIENDK
jgi:hypothetical protein